MFKTSKYLKEIAHSSDILYPISEIELKELQKCLLEIYIDINKVCQKYNLKLMLAYGSALGAVRHKGFIPWDDDLDVMMFRNDYDKFISIFSKELSDKYDLLAPNTNKPTKSLFAKVIKKSTAMVEILDINAPYEKGIFLDIFPIEYLPKSKIIRFMKKWIANGLIYISLSTGMFQFRNNTFKKYMNYSFQSRLNYNIRLTLGFIFSFLSHDTWCNIFDKFVQGKPNKLYHLPTAEYTWKGMDYDILLPMIESDFEGIKANIPHKYDTYLKYYGDYMTLPPLEKRERHYYVEFSTQSSPYKYKSLLK